MKLFKQIYLNHTFFYALIGLVVIFVFGHFIPIFYAFGKMMLILFAILFFIDFMLLFNTRAGISASRICPEKLSNGDENIIRLNFKNNYRQSVTLKIIDEAPIQFQIRNFKISTYLNSREEKSFSYTLRPVERGEYHFGRLNVYASSIFRLVSKRYIFNADEMTPVYPSFLQMRKFELLAIHNRLTDAGIKKIRKIGQHTEFDQIREYVFGDDYRTINWKATARKALLMVNQYQEEKSQQVFSIIDMGRVMKSPFNGMTLLDYAINASLVISNIAIYKQDKAGLITLTDKINAMVPAKNKPSHILQILEVLYNQKTNFVESNYELLYVNVKKHIKQRSLLLLYTNFETLSSLKRQINYLKRLAKDHLLVVIFFENTETRTVLDEHPATMQEIYIKTIAEKFDFEKRQIVKELKKSGIHTVLTAPEDLSVNTINKYLELKAQGLI